MADGGERINDARRHVRSARELATTDPTLAISACHDAVRKSVTGHMAAVGFRPRGGEGAHRIALDYARQELQEFIEAGDLHDADDLRKDRALAQYGSFAIRQISSEQVHEAADVAERIVNGVAKALATMTRQLPRKSD